MSVKIDRNEKNIQKYTDHNNFMSYKKKEKEIYNLFNLIENDKNSFENIKNEENC